jgi:predicted RNA-binding protein with PUA-like domain
MATFLLKTEPGDYSFQRLIREKRCVWTGVSNPTALIHLRAMKAGDLAFIYHTGNEKAVVGLAKVTRGAFEDPDKPGLNERGEPKAAVVELAPVAPSKSPVTLAAIKADPRFRDFALVTMSRLSVMPVGAAHEKALRTLAGL